MNYLQALPKFYLSVFFLYQFQCRITNHIYLVYLLSVFNLEQFPGISFAIVTLTFFKNISSYLVEWPSVWAYLTLPQDETAYPLLASTPQKGCCASSVYHPGRPCCHNSTCRAKAPLLCLEAFLGHSCSAHSISQSNQTPQVRRRH